MSLKNIIKEWMLPIAMLTGASIYLIYHYMPEPVHRIGPLLSGVVEVLQPLLIFLMLFFTFCGIEPRQLKPHRWHWWLLLVQGGTFTLLASASWALQRLMPGSSPVLIESAMLCFICPTATAAAVVTRKLGGDVPGITTYIVLMNILAAVLIPLIVPLVRPETGVAFGTAFSMILAKVFPLLITPCLCAWLVRYLMPGLLRKLLRYPELPFYLWAVALTLAIAVTTKSIVNTHLTVRMLLWMVLVSLVSCVLQFAIGRWTGGVLVPRKYQGTLVSAQECNKITAGQSLGQKNTVFAIWMGYTFMTPETAIIGGLYSIWHNIYNSWQLRRSRLC